MRYLFYIGLILFMPNFIIAQTLNDVNYLTQNSLSGSARYTSMAGAFGALGGDLSAVSDNPAGSSIFLNTEVGGSINFQSKNTNGIYFDTTESLQKENFYFDQIGAVFVFNNTDTKSSWSRISAAINVNRISNYDQEASISGNGRNSIAEYFLYYADGINFEDIQLYDDETIADIYRFLGDEIGFGAQQAFLGYQSYIIDPLTNNALERTYFSNINSNQYAHYLNIINKGVHRKTSFNFSALYQNFIHLGFNINQHRIKYNNKSDFFENEQDLDSFVYDVNFNNSLITDGDGFSLQFGAILKLKDFRFGLSYDSPQWINLKDETQQSISSYRFDEGYAIREKIVPDITNSFDPYQLKIPSKTNLSFAYVFKEKGLISIDYNIQNLSNILLSQTGGSSYLDEVSSEINSVFKPIKTVKIGGEYRLKDISLRAGYFYRTKNQEFVAKNNEAFTFGIGFDFGASSLNLSFVQLEQNQSFQLFSNGLIDSYDINKKLTQLTMSFNFKL